MTASLVEGALQKVWVKAQSTYDTLVAFASTDAVSPLKGSFKIEPEYPHEESKEAAGTASLQDEIAQKRGGKWSGSFYVKPNAVGVAPDIGELIKAAMGVETVVGATSVTYSLSDTVRNALQALQQVSTVFGHIASGMWVEEMSIEMKAGELPLISFSGGFASYAWVSEDVVGTGNIAYNATSLPLGNTSRGCGIVGGRLQFSTPVDDGGVAGLVTSANAQTYDFSAEGNETLTLKVDGGSVQTVTFVAGDFVAENAGTAAEVVTKINSATTGCTAYATGDVPAKVAIVSDTVGTAGSIQVTGGTANAVILAFDTDVHTGTAGTGYAITAIVDTDDAATMTISPAVVSRAGHAAATALVPWYPAHTTSGTKLGGGAGTMTIGSVTVGVASAKITLNTGIKGLEEATSEVPARLGGGGERRVSFDISAYALTTADGNINFIGRAWEGPTHDLLIRVGPATAAQRMTINMNKARIEVTPIEIPEADEAMIKITGKARQNSTAADEMTLVFD